MLCYRHASNASEIPVTWAAAADDDEHIWDIVAICSGTETPWKIWNDWISNTALYTCCWVAFLVLEYSIVCWSKPRISILVSFHSVVVWPSVIERIIALHPWRIDRSSSVLIHTPSTPSSDRSSMRGISKTSSTSANLTAFGCVLVRVLGDMMSNSNRELQEEAWTLKYPENGGILRLFENGLQLLWYCTREIVSIQSVSRDLGLLRGGCESWFCHHVKKRLWEEKLLIIVPVKGSSQHHLLCSSPRKFLLLEWLFQTFDCTLAPAMTKIKRISNTTLPREPD
jgi:hypothetical protein